MSALVMRVAFCVLALLGASRAAGAQDMHFAAVPPDPSAASSGVVTIAYSGAYGAYEVCYTEWDCWYEYWYADVDPATLSLLVNGRQSASLLQPSGTTNDGCTYYFDERGGIDGYDCSYSGSFTGTVGWAAGAPTALVATMGSTYGVIQANHSFNPNIAVSPDARHTIRAGGGWYTETFTVSNPSAVGNNFYLSAACTGAMINCPGPSSLYVGPGASAPVNVSYQAAGYSAANPSSGGTMTLRAQAGAYVDTGTVSIQTVPVVSVQTANPGGDLERDNCLTFSAGMNAAVQCSDVQVTHPLPSVRTNGKSRTLSMLYNSRTASAVPVIAADIRLPAGMPTPTRVKAVLYAGTLGALDLYTARDSGEWRGSDFAPGSTRRISFAYDAGANSSGAYGYQVRVTFWDGSTPSVEYPSDDGTLVLANRRTTPYGAGWWPAGVEQLVVPTSGDLTVRSWIAGDGSTRLYRQVRSNVWMAGAIDRPDSLTYDPASGQYTRWGPHRLRVNFDGLGRHVATVTRTGDSTTFAYDALNRLEHVTVPRLPGNAYTFKYPESGGPPHIVVDAPSVTAGGTPRSTTLVLEGPTLKAAWDPDGRPTQFWYYWFEGRPYQFYARTGKGNATQYFYYRGAFHVTRVVQQDAVGGYTIPHDFPQIAELAGLRAPPGQQAISADPQPLAVFTGHTGARFNAGQEPNEWMQVAVDRFGAPTQIRNYQHSTTIERGDVRFPGLVTQVTAPTGSVTTAAYDDRGNLLTSTAVNPYGDGRDAVAQFEWDRTWDFVARSTQPEGERTEFGYDGTNGNRLWQQDGRGAASRTTFTYDGRFLSTVQPAGATCNWGAAAAGCQRFTPDGLGNLADATNEVGGRTRFSNDPIGRTWKTSTLVVGQLWQDETSTFDVMDRDTLHVSTGPALNGAPDASLYVRRALDAEGADSIVTRWSSPDTASIGPITTRFIRDGLGRVVQEIAPDNAVDRTEYDLSGNVKKRITRNQKTQEFSYDGLNRLRRRTTDPAHFDPETIGMARSAGMSGNPVEASTPGAELTQAYPWQRPSGYDIPTTVDEFIYRPADGMLTDANNAFASVHREYYPNGQLRSEENTQQPWVAGQGAPHAFRDSIGYDRNGRRTYLRYPDVLAPTTGAAVRYAYSAIGDLDRIEDLNGRGLTIRMGYTPRGELASRALTDGITSQFAQVLAYRDDGSLLSDQVTIGTTAARNQTFTYDARGKRTGMNDGGAWSPGSEQHAYTGLGQLVSSTNSIPNFSATSTYQLDGFGNMIKRSGAEASLTPTFNGTTSTTSRNDGEEWQYYQPSTGRLWFSKNFGSRDTSGANPGSGSEPAAMNRYDAAGNLIWTGRATLEVNASGYPKAQTERRMYYGADGKLRAVDARALYLHPSASATSSARGFSRSFEEYRYDAFGRRVATKFDQECDWSIEFNLHNSACHLSGIRRTVWDGSTELGEIQVPNEGLENDYYAGQGDYSSGRNLSPFYGAVAYVYDGQVDQPVSVTRLRYANLTPPGTVQLVGPFTFYPLWNARGQSEFGFSLAAIPACDPATTVSGDRVSCVSYVGQLRWLPYRRVTDWQKSWQGTLLEEKAGAGGLMYRRNRYYDSQSGRFTQEDPIGLAGGVNLYGFAGGDPVNFSDPFGLSPGDTVDVGCRPLEGAAGAVGNHCAVRVGEGDNKQAGELLNVGSKNEITLLDPNDPSYTWTTVPVPAGMTSRQFDASVIRSFNTIGKAYHGGDYSSRGALNSNHFIWSVITGAGGRVPSGAVPRHGLTPGLCGGTSRFGLGNQCSP